MSSEIKVGSPVWVFDRNRRIYEPGRGLGRKLLWREHWVKKWVVGETRVSWLISADEKMLGAPLEVQERGWSLTKLKKKGAETAHGFLWSEAEVEAQSWLVQNRREIVDTFMGLDGAEAMAAIRLLVAHGLWKGPAPPG